MHSQRKQWNYSENSQLHWTSHIRMDHINIDALSWTGGRWNDAVYFSFLSEFTLVQDFPKDPNKPPHPPTTYTVDGGYTQGWPFGPFTAHVGQKALLLFVSVFNQIFL